MCYTMAVFKCLLLFYLAALWIMERGEGSLFSAFFFLFFFKRDFDFSFSCCNLDYRLDFVGMPPYWPPTIINMGFAYSTGLTRHL